MIGILAAMPAEIEMLKKHVTEQSEHSFGAVFSFTTGKLRGKPVVFGAANVGFIFASSAVTTMINHFKVETVIFTGVAGGLKEGQRIGDIIVGEHTGIAGFSLVFRKAHRSRCTWCCVLRSVG